MLIVRAEVEGVAPIDVRIARGRITEVGRDLTRQAGEETLDAAGGALLPGLHDHHVHLLALAAAQTSLRCGPPDVRDRDALARVLRGAARPGRWLRGVGYHESVAGPLDRTRLDAFVCDAPVRIQHRSGALWMLNSDGVRRLGLDAGADAAGVERDAGGRATGRLFRLDAWLRQRAGDAAKPELASVGRALARMGVTGVTDATAESGARELELLEQAVASGALPQRVIVMGSPSLPEPRQPGLERGAVKFLLDERALPEPGALAERMGCAHAARRAVAVHCTTRAELVLAAVALREAGPVEGDRIEHASVAPPDAVQLLAEIGCTVVTQPNFVWERGDAYAAEVEPRDLPWLYRCRGLVASGIPLGAGTDAPFGEPDPWRAMRAAVDRRSRDGRILGAEEAVSPERALALFTTPAEAPGGAPRRIRVGAPADCCLLAAPWAVARERLASDLVAATLRRGDLVWR